MVYLIYKYAQHYNHINKVVLDNQAKLASLEKYFSSEVEWKIKIESVVKSSSFKIKQMQQELKQKDKLLNHSLELINGMKLVEHLKNEKDFDRKAELNQYQQPLCDDQEPGGKKILSFSLYGKKAGTYGRFIKNIIEEARTLEIHRHFTIRIYVDHHFPHQLDLITKKNLARYNSVMQIMSQNMAIFQTKLGPFGALFH